MEKNTHRELSHETNISFIVAMTLDNVIGAKNTMPWYLPEDLKKFRDLTMDHPMVMGRRTFESLPKVLPGREHFVVTSNPAYKEENPRAADSRHVHVFTSPAQALVEADKSLKISGQEKKEIFIIGGGVLFSSMLSLANKLYVTLIKEHIEGDTYFPEIREEEWSLIKEEDFDGYSFLTYIRK